MDEPRVFDVPFYCQSCGTENHIPVAAAYRPCRCGGLVFGTIPPLGVRGTGTNVQFQHLRRGLQAAIPQVAFRQEAR